MQELSPTTLLKIKEWKYVMYCFNQSHLGLSYAILPWQLTINRHVYLLSGNYKLKKMLIRTYSIVEKYLELCHPVADVRRCWDSLVRSILLLPPVSGQQGLSLRAHPRMYLFCLTVGKHYGKWSMKCIFSHCEYNCIKSALWLDHLNHPHSQGSDSKETILSWFCQAKKNDKRISIKQGEPFPLLVKDSVWTNARLSKFSVISWRRRKMPWVVYTITAGWIETNTIIHTHLT